MTGPAEDVAAFKTKAEGKCPYQKDDQEVNVLNFHNLLPLPAEVLQAGAPAGYFWELENWGCKWGAFETILVETGEGHLIYKFDTPWSPPTAFLKALAPQMPSLKFALEYEEPMMAFKGLAKAQGQQFEDHRIRE